MNPRRIALLHPSRGRPEKALATYKRWKERSGGHYEHIIGLDYDDVTVPKYLELFAGIEVMLTVNKNESVVQATNFIAKRATAGIMVYLSDDFDCPEDWAGSLREEFYKVDRPALVKVDDCLQPFHVRVLTIPIMNYQLYERLGYFWNPLYKSMFVDEDLYWTAEKLEALRFAPHLRFPHNHVSVGKADNDETYKRSAANWDQGKATFARRKAAGFPL